MELKLLQNEEHNDLTFALYELIDEMKSKSVSYEDKRNLEMLRHSLIYSTHELSMGFDLTPLRVKEGLLQAVALIKRLKGIRIRTNEYKNINQSIKGARAAETSSDKSMKLKKLNGREKYIYPHRVKGTLKWDVSINYSKKFQFNGSKKRIYLGRFDTMEEAIVARDAKLKEIMVTI